jgi:hypothetical protein
MQKLEAALVCPRSLLIAGEVLLVDGRLGISRADGRQRTPESGDYGARRGDAAGERCRDELGAPDRRSLRRRRDHGVRSA